MSNAWGWFGGGSTQRSKDGPNHAIVGLREQLELLQKRDRHLEGKMDEQLAIARKFGSTNKAAAKKALERKKQYQNYREQTEGHINTIEQQILAIESANINRETLGALERAATAMGHIHNNLTPGKVDETMEKIRDQNALGEEIGEAMSSLNTSDPLDDADLAAELEELQQENLDEQILNIERVSVPRTLVGVSTACKTGVPANTHTMEEDDEDAELNQLEADMAL